MRKNDVMAVLFSNVHDEFMNDMTAARSMASLPFCGRYSLIDFSLSLAVNAGIGKVGIITKANYQSLMDHIGTGKAWDLDRKSGGLFFLPPYSTAGAKFNNGHIDGLYGAMPFLSGSTEEYVVLCDADVITNFDAGAMIEKHISSGADVTVAYKQMKMPKNNSDVMAFTVDGDKITDIAFFEDEHGECNVSLDIMVVKRSKLIELVKYGHEHNFNSISRDIIQPKCKELDIRGYEVTEYAAIMDSMESYAKITNEVVNNPTVRRQLFCRERPVFTKTRDDMPTVYGLDSDVTNCIIADGCVIEGKVKNSVLFRGVKVGKNALIENSIVMQDTVIGEGAELRYVTVDKNVKIGAYKTLHGADTYPIYICKKAEV